MAGMMMVGIAVDQLYHRWNSPSLQMQVGTIVKTINAILKENKQAKKNKYDYKKDQKWHKSYADKGEHRDKRYGVASYVPTFKVEYLKWSGKRHILREELRRLIRLVYKRLPHIKTTESSVELMVETIIAESDGGTDIINKYNDCGLAQMKVSATKDMLKWLKENHKDIYDALMSLRNPDLNEKDNLIKNCPYNIAIGITKYWRMCGHNFHHHISTKLERAEMWKSRYNTHLGLGTVQAYLNRDKSYDKRTTTSVVATAD